MPQEMSDIDVLTQALVQFGQQDAMRPQLDEVAPAAAGAGTGAGLMEESVALQRADQEATDAMMKYLTEVDQGMTGYREGVNRIAEVYNSTEGKVLKTMEGLMPQQAGLPAVDERFVLAKQERN